MEQPTKGVVSPRDDGRELTFRLAHDELANIICRTMDQSWCFKRLGFESKLEKAEFLLTLPLFIMPNPSGHS